MAISDGRMVLTDSVASSPPDEDFSGSIAGRLNWLRAGVLGANDGIVSTAAIVLGVAGATAARGPILLAGVVGLLAGAMSMAVGEYVSVSTQRDTERALIVRAQRRLTVDPDRELAALTAVYADKGLDAELAAQVARELTENDALGAHVQTRLGIDPDELTQPWHAAIASFVSFVIGAAVPLVAVMVSPNAWVTVMAVALALMVTGALSAKLGRAPISAALVRNVGGGLLAMAITYGLGSLVGGLIL